MSLSTLSVQRPVLALVMNIAIMLFGWIGFTRLGVREFPAIDPPVVNVRTNYTGANPDIIESQITEPLEKAINGVEGIRTISSASNLGSSVITVEFELGEDMERATNDVRDKVMQAQRSLPNDLDGPPVVSKADANSDAILSMTLQSDTRTHLEISDYAENVLVPRLQTIPGVSGIQIWGQKRYAMRIWMDPVKLAAFRLTPQDVFSALDRENVELPSGKISGDQTELSVKTLGRLTTEEEFNSLIINNVDSRVVRLEDVGYAELGPENYESILRSSGVPMIGMALSPQPGANVVAIADEFYTRMEQIKKELPPDLRTNVALDSTVFIRNSIYEVVETLAIAIGLVVLVILLFFRDLSIALRPLLDIPVSLTGAFFIMFVLGYSINVLTLLAIVLATGLVVDDGIVVTENIFKKIEKGLSPVKAAIEGSNEIFFAVISTSLALAAVFLPIIFMEGFTGRLFQEFGMVLAGAVLISAFVSLSLTPMLNAKLMRPDRVHGKIYNATEPFFVRMENGYRNSLDWFLKRRWLAFVIIGAASALIFLAGRTLPSELAPLDDRSVFRIQVTAPEGASYEYTDRVVLQLTQFLEEAVPEREMILTVTAPGFTGSGAVNTAFLRVRLPQPAERERSQQDIAATVGKGLMGYNDARAFVVQDQTIGVGGGRFGQPVQYVLQAPNFERLREVLPVFLDEARKRPELMGVDANLKFNKPELNITIDRDKARALGVSTLELARTLQLAFSGLRFAYFTQNGKQYQVIGQFDRANRDEPLDVKTLAIRNANGELIQLDNLVQVEEISSPPQLYHHNRYMSATISASMAPGYTIGDAIDAMDEIAATVLDETFTTDLSGPSRDFQENSSNLLFAFLLALVLIYMLLAAQFESFRDPLIIMLTVPLALAGAVLSLWYFNQTLNIFSQIGMIMLIGLVTKNGILIVEFANQLRDRGLARAEAIREASAARLRPILMTSIATAFGALPIALALGAGVKSRMSMGTVVVGGVMFSLIFTLFVIPVMYSYLSSRSRKKISDEGDVELNYDPEPASPATV